MDRGGRTRTCNPRFWRPVLCQLSYAPRFAAHDCTRGDSGIDSRMSDHESEPRQEERDEPDDDLLERQIGKGYGDDEGEREESLEDD